MVEKLRRILFRTDRSGLEHVLGSLEAGVMEVVWRTGGPVRIRDVWEQLKTGRRLSFNTVMTVMNRLAGKGLLVKQGDGPPYLYAPAMDRESFIRRMLGDVISSLVRDYGSFAVSQFVETVVTTEPEAAAELERLLARLREGEQETRATGLGRAKTPE